MDKDFRRMVVKMCESTDLDNKDAVTSTMYQLGKLAIEMNEVNEVYENKLKELMVVKDWEDFTVKMAKDLFRKQIESMPDGDFKNFAIENFDAITDLEGLI